ncbi:hypothetical protein Q3G72_019920 [Acer saccharum]|nr:hypothetical protein Q3G72_019920 [Acer saccharum]
MVFDNGVFHINPKPGTLPSSFGFCPKIILLQIQKPLSAILDCCLPFSSFASNFIEPKSQQRRPNGNEWGRR